MINYHIDPHQTTSDYCQTIKVTLPDVVRYRSMK